MNNSMKPKPPSLRRVRDPSSYWFLIVPAIYLLGFCIYFIVTYI